MSVHPLAGTLAAPRSADTLLAAFHNFTGAIKQVRSFIPQLWGWRVLIYHCIFLLGGQIHYRANAEGIWVGLCWKEQVILKYFLFQIHQHQLWQLLGKALNSELPGYTETRGTVGLFWLLFMWG